MELDDESIASVEPGQWFALEVKFQHERVIASRLVAKGYRAFAPTCVSEENTFHKQDETERCLFPGYVFSKFDSRCRLPILTTPGVRRVVGFGRVPAPIDSAEIDAVIGVVKSKSIAAPYTFLQEGARVRIVRGPLAGIDGFLLESRSGCRIVLSVSLIQRSIRVEVERDAIRPVGARQAELSTTSQSHLSLRPFACHKSQISSS